jgi:hypothetical protein
MAQLAQVYIRLRPYSVDHERFFELGHATDQLVQTAAEPMYEQPVEIDLAVEGGALKAVFTVVGPIFLGPYCSGGNYKAFKAGVVEMCKDAERFGIDVSGAFAAATGAKPNQIERKIRLKTPGKLKGLIEDAERLEGVALAMSAESLELSLAPLSRRWRQIEKDLTDEEAARVASALKFENLPPLPEWPKGVGNEIRRVGPRVFRPIKSIQMKAAPGDRFKPAPLKYRNRVSVGLRHRVGG